MVPMSATWAFRSGIFFWLIHIWSTQKLVTSPCGDLDGLLAGGSSLLQGYVKEPLESPV